ncbi:MAG: tetratricopeptide repeat protein [Nitrospirota bacterium]
MANEFFHLGVRFYQQGHYEKAIEYFRKALRLNPGLIHAYNYLGNAYQEVKQFDQAMASYARAMEMCPSDPTAFMNAGIACQNTARDDAAAVYFRKALAVAPHREQIYEYLGFTLMNQGKFEEALEVYRSLLQTNRSSVTAFIRIGSILKQQGRQDKSEEYLRAARESQPDNIVPWQSFLAGMLYNPRHDMGAVFREHVKFAEKFAEPLAPRRDVFPNNRSKTRRLKIGYVSPDFKNHSVSYFIEPVLASHTREQYEIFCFSDVCDPDEVTSRIRGYADQWRDIAGLTDAAVHRLIRNDAIDVLVDLAGHTARNRMLLFARRPAPVQVTWIGYPATTGLSAMDYRIVDDYTDPPGTTEKYYTEKLLRIPGCSLCYLPDRESPLVGPLPARVSGHVTFGSFNHFAKVTPPVIALWAEILGAVRDSRLVLKANSLSDHRTQRYVGDAFLEAGIPGTRIKLLGWETDKRRHLETYNRVDIALDTFPYHGTTTTCEALWMGVPVITLAGDLYASRTGISLLSNAGLPELVARSSEEYVGKAIHLAGDLEKLESLRRGLREMMKQSPLTDAGRLVKNLEDSYRQMWETWCKT